MATASETWDRICRWLEINMPRVLIRLNPGASIEKLKELEEVIGFTDLPNDFKESYYLHDGFCGGSFFSTPTVCNTFLTVSEIITRWKVNKSVLDLGPQCVDPIYKTKTNDDPEEIQRKWWDVRWIVFGMDGFGNTLTMDLAPTEAGSYGQVIQRYFDGRALQLYASSFLEYLKKFADDLENGKFGYLELVDSGIISLYLQE